MASGVKTLKIVNSMIRTRLALFNEITEVYKPAISRNKDKLIELIKEKAAQARQSEIAKKLKVAKGYYTLEMAPPSGNEMQKLQSDLALVKEFFKSGCYKYLTVRQAWLLILVGTEIGLWFFLGETIGKMHFVGYKVVNIQRRSFFQRRIGSSDKPTPSSHDISSDRSTGFL